MNFLVVTCLIIIIFQIVCNHCSKSLVCGIKNIDEYILCLKNINYNSNKIIETLYFDFLKCKEDSVTNFYMKLELEDFIEKSNIELFMINSESKIKYYLNMPENIDKYKKISKLDRKTIFKCLRFMFTSILIFKLNFQYIEKVVLTIFAIYSFYLISFIEFDYILSIVLLIIVSLKDSKTGKNQKYSKNIKTNRIKFRTKN